MGHQIIRKDSDFNWSDEEIFELLKLRNLDCKSKEKIKRLNGKMKMVRERG